MQRELLGDKFFAPVEDLSIQRLSNSTKCVSSNLLKFKTCDFRGKFREQSSWRQVFENEVIDVHQHFIEAVKVKTVLLDYLKYCQCSAKNSTGSLEEEEIPDNEACLHRDLRNKDLDEPWKDHKVDVKHNLLEMISELR